MSSTKEYLEFILEQLSNLNDIRYRAMMGEFIIYYQNKIIGGIYDDRFLVKQTKSSKKLMPDAPLELPYEGAKEMLPVAVVAVFANILLLVVNTTSSTGAAGTFFITIIDALFKLLFNVFCSAVS